MSRMRQLLSHSVRPLAMPFLVCGLVTAAVAGIPDRGPDFDREIAPLLKGRCVRCHGPAREEGKLNLALPPGIARGGKSGPPVRAGSAANSLLWQRVAANQMPPDAPLSAPEKDLLRRWIQTGATGLPVRTARPVGEEHWAFQAAGPVGLPMVRGTARVRTPVDRFILARLEAAGLTLSPEAERHTLIRRVALDLTGLPPTPADVTEFVRDSAHDAYERMVERYLSSPRYAERWGKYWLDAAGYADSNGYFSADTDRPLAYRYRDYVVRSIHADKPWDQFIREQLAGDELAGYGPGGEVRPDMVELLEAAHYLRNAPDGTDSSDGNPDEQRADKYAVLEGTIQVMGASLFGLTVQCARCHDHKFEPFRQRDYYQLQAVLYPAFNIERWVKPKDRELVTATPAEIREWERRTAEIDRRIAGLRAEYRDWATRNRERGRTLFEDGFDGTDYRVAHNWSNRAPGDTTPAGQPAVMVDAAQAPAARALEGVLRIQESGGSGDRALSTLRSFDWTPEGRGAWVQATFDLVGGGPTAPYVGYFLALRDFNDATSAPGGNVLLDGNAAGGAAVHVDYPGAGSEGRGKIGRSGYTPGHNYGVRVTNVGDGRFELTQMVDGVADEGTVRLRADDLPDGGFGFEYCCGRSFAVDNVRIEAGDSHGTPEGERARLATLRQQRREALEAAVKAVEAGRPPKPGRLALVADLAPEPPAVHLLERGEYKRPGAPVPAAAPLLLSEPANPATLAVPSPGSRSTGRRLAFAQWLTKPGSRAAALLARVTVNRWWQHHFGVGLVATPENLGYSGATPTHPELLEYLAGRLMTGGWSARSIHRLILHSAVYRQSSVVSPVARRLDPDNRLVSRYPLHRLDAEAIRDGLLAVSGELDLRMGGAYVPTSRDAEGDVVVAENTDGSLRRSVYLQQRRTQVPGILEVFDAPSIVTNCTARPTTTIPLQALKLLNSGFLRARAAAFARRGEAGTADSSSRVEAAFQLALCRAPRPAEQRAAAVFLSPRGQTDASDLARQHALWTDFCQMLLASNSFLYVE